MGEHNCMPEEQAFVKRFSQTRRSTNADGMKALMLNCLEELETLSTIAECPSTKPESG